MSLYINIMKLFFKSSKFYFFSSLIFITISIFRIVSIYFGNNSLNKYKNTYREYLTILPQGWAFFTKNSREPLVHIYSYNNSSITPITYRNFSLENNFGASRHNRILNLEGTQLTKIIYKDSLKPVIKKSLNIAELEPFLLKHKFIFKQYSIDKSKTPDIKGKYLIIIQDQLPWSLIQKKPTYKSNFKIYSIENL